MQNSDIICLKYMGHSVERYKLNNNNNLSTHMWSVKYEIAERHRKLYICGSLVSMGSHFIHFPQSWRDLWGISEGKVQVWKVRNASGVYKRWRMNAASGRAPVAAGPGDERSGALKHSPSHYNKHLPRTCTHILERDIFSNVMASFNSTKTRNKSQI